MWCVYVYAHKSMLQTILFLMSCFNSLFSRTLCIKWVVGSWRLLSSQAMLLLFSLFCKLPRQSTPFLLSFTIQSFTIQSSKLFRCPLVHLLMIWQLCVLYKWAYTGDCKMKIFNSLFFFLSLWNSWKLHNLISVWIKCVPDAIQL